MKLLEKAVMVIEAYKQVATKYKLQLNVSRDNACIFIDMSLHKVRGEVMMEIELVRELYQMAKEINHYTVLNISFFEQKEKDVEDLDMVSGTRWYGIHSIIKYHEFPDEPIMFQNIDQVLSNIKGIYYKIG